MDGGDLALMGGYWLWQCPECYGEGDGGFDDGGLDLSDRDGDGDFDTDDMLIIIEEMNDKDDDEGARVDSPDRPALALVLDSPVVWGACWLGAVTALLRTRRRRRAG